MALSLILGDTESFNPNGPTYLPSIMNWSNPHHRRSVAACLANAVNIIEGDRQNKRRAQYALAPPWWEAFNFQLLEELVDDDASVFGAIFQFKSNPYYQNNPSIRRAPRYVVAFRGTLLRADTILEDIILDIKIILSDLHDSPRFARAINAVQKLLPHAGGASNIWLTGHSLGSGIAMIVGKAMARRNNFIETYLFNPPFPSSPVEWLNNSTLVDGFRFCRSVVRATLSVVVNKSPKENDPFFGLYGWTPYLFVNPNDVICSEYIGYFEHRKKMKEIGAGKIEGLATRYSLASLCLGFVTGKESEPVHLIPSAFVTINQSKPLCLISAHEICQWWKEKFNGQYKLYQFRKEDFQSDTDM